MTRQDPHQVLTEKDKRDRENDFKLNRAFKDLGVALLFLAICSGCASGYWFYQSTRLRSTANQFEEKTKSTSKLSEQGGLGFGLIESLQSKVESIQDAVEAAALLAEKRTYQFLGLAMFLGFSGFYLFDYGNSKIALSDSATDQDRSKSITASS